MVAISYIWPFQFMLIQIKDIWKINFSLKPVTVQAVSSYMWLVDTVLNSADIEHSITAEGFLDRSGLESEL